MWPSKPEVLTSPTVWQISLQFRRRTWGFRSGRARRKCSQVTITSNDNRKWQYRGFGCQFFQFLVVNLCRRHLANFLSSSSSSRIPNLALEFRRYLSQFQRCNYFRFWGHIDLQLSVASYSLANTIFHLYMGLNLRFVVWILTVPHTVSKIKIFPVSAAISDCRSLLESPRYSSCELAMVVCRRFHVVIWWYHSFGDITTSG